MNAKKRNNERTNSNKKKKNVYAYSFDSLSFLFGYWRLLQPTYIAFIENMHIAHIYFDVLYQSRYFYFNQIQFHALFAHAAHDNVNLRSNNNNNNNYNNNYNNKI